MTKEIKALIAKYVPKGTKIRKHVVHSRYLEKYWSGVCVTYGPEDIAWRLNGKIHRIGGPAVIRLNGSVEWTVSGWNGYGPTTDTKEYWEKCYEFCKGTELEKLCISKILGAKE